MIIYIVNVIFMIIYIVNVMMFGYRVTWRLPHLPLANAPTAHHCHHHRRRDHHHRRHHHRHYHHHCHYVKRVMVDELIVCIWDASQFWALSIYIEHHTHCCFEKQFLSNIHPISIEITSKSSS